MIEILLAWEQWTGPAKGFYTAIGISAKGISSIIGKAKKLRREGFPIDGFKKVSKYRCSCHACIKMAPMPARIISGSSYSDDMMVDVVCSKYCDLIPIERYVQMAGRGGLVGLPPQSLIELTHQFAEFIS